MGVMYSYSKVVNFNRPYEYRVCDILLKLIVKTNLPGFFRTTVYIYVDVCVRVAS